MLLLLAGSGEGRVIAQKLAENGISAVASLAGVTRSPTELGLPTRTGGFGGREGFIRYLRDKGITAILDATHPFASYISSRTANVAQEQGIPYMQFLRPEWRPEAGDRWTFLDDERQVAEIIAPGSTVFLATGRQTLLRFSNLKNCEIICRQIDAPDGPFPFPNGRYLLGRPPFSVDQEIDLFRKLSVDWLVVKNAGGQASKSKLEAARILKINVAMIRRPVLLNAARVDSIDAALEWVRSLR